MVITFEKIPKYLLKNIIFRYLNNLHDIYSISLVSKKYFSIFLGNPNLFNLLLNKYGGVYTKINPDLSNNLYNRIQIPKLFLEKRIIVNWNKKTFAKLMLVHGLIHEQKRKYITNEYSKWLSYSIPIPKYFHTIHSEMCKEQCNKYYNLVRNFDTPHWSLYNKIKKIINIRNGPYSKWENYSFNDALKYYFNIS